MDVIWAELSAGLPNVESIVRMATRLLAAVLLGAVIGLQRMFVGAAAVLRTYMLVALATCIFVLAPQTAGMNDDQLSRVIQGVCSCRPVTLHQRDRGSSTSRATRFMALTASPEA